MRMRRLAQLWLVAAVALAVCAPAGHAARAVPEFSVAANVKKVKVSGRTVHVVDKIWVSGIHGTLHVACNGCRRLQGRVRRSKQAHSIVILGENWILSSRMSVYVSVEDFGLVGRYLRLKAALRRNRLVLKESGCLANGERRACAPLLTPAPARTAPITPTPATTTTTPAAPPPPDTTAPAAPTGLHVVDSTASSVTVAWTAPADPSGIRSYDIGLNGRTVGTVPSASVRLLDLSCQTGYHVTVTATDGAGNVSAAAGTDVVTASCPAILHYSCSGGNGPSAGHYVPAGRYWGNDFTAQGRVITGGTLGLGANPDGGDHRAKIGIYTVSNGTATELESVIVNVSGYGGVSFTLPTALNVTPGDALTIIATGIGDFTAYDRVNDNVDGCLIGTVAGVL